MVDTSNPVENNIKSLNEHNGLENEGILHPTTYKTIMQYQQIDKELIKIAQTNEDYSIQNFQWPNKKYSLLCRNSKIVIPKQLDNKL